MKKIIGLFLFLLTNTVYAMPFLETDVFGYTGKDIAFNLRDVSGSGTDIGLDSADDETSVISIGFNFTFYGNTYSDVEISSNGFVSFTQTGNSACCDGETITTPGGTIDNFIAGYWEDLDLGEGGILRTQTLGAFGTRELIIGFYDVRDNDAPADSINTFEIILHEFTNDIELQLAQIQFDDIDDKVIGIENIDGSDGIEVAFFDANSHSNGDILFSNEAFCFSTGGTNCGNTSKVVPEPASLALLGLGLAGFCFSRKKKTT